MSEATVNEIRDLHWRRSGEVLTALRQAFDRLNQSEIEWGLSVMASAQDAAGSVIGDGYVGVERVNATSRWMLAVGWGSPPTSERTAQAPSWDDCIDYEQPSGFPPLTCPVRSSWTGSDRFNRRVIRDVPLESIILQQTSMRWADFNWSVLDKTTADRLVRAMVSRTLAHESPSAAAMAQPGARWRHDPIDQRPTHGGQAVVWRVRDSADQNSPLFAMKMMRYPKSRTSRGYARFQREIEAVESLSHPHIVPIVDKFLSSDDAFAEPYYVMPWAQQTLHSAAPLLRGNIVRVLEIGVQLADALVASHNASPSIVHRDVKPQNVLMLGDPLAPMLADYGICYLRTEEDGERLTRIVDDTVGSDDFVAPELQGGRLDDVDGRVDVFSLGKTLFAAAFGGQVFPRWHIDDPRYDLHSGTEDGDRQVDHFLGVIRLMVAERPEDRPINMKATKALLERALTNVGDSTPYMVSQYAEKASAAEQTSALLRRLIEPLPVTVRADAVRNAIEDTISLWRTQIRVSAIGRDRQFRSVPDWTDLAALGHEVTDLLCATALPLVMHAEADSVDRLFAELSDSLNEDRNNTGSAITMLEQGSAVAMLFVVAAMAWHLERWTVFAACLTRFDAAPFRMSYLSLRDGNSGKSRMWVIEGIRRSIPLSLADPRFAGAADHHISQSSGALLLGLLVKTEPTSRIQFLSDNHCPPDLPALHDGDWPNSLAKRFLENPSFEAQVATSGMGTNTSALRTMARDITPDLVRAIAKRLKTAPLLQLGFGPESLWNRWCGGTLHSSE